MSDVPTNFPPQTYSSSFFLNNLAEDDKRGGSLRRKLHLSKEKAESSTLFDCFIKSLLAGPQTRGKTGVEGNVEQAKVISAS
ncbi:hypothetical protein Trydic_g23421 [Trypoxylus dichotomus]